MPNATIAAKFVNPPKVQGNSWSVKDATGAFWSFYPEKCKLDAGKVYDIEYTEKPRAAGGTYKNIVKATEKARPPQAANGHVGHGFDDRGGVPPHVSNWVAHAIQAGLIKKPEEMSYWAQWAFYASRTMAKPPEDADEPPHDESPVPSEADYGT